MVLQAEDVIGQPISGMVDCYQPGRGDTGVPVGTTHYPQGPNGPKFEKVSERNPKTGGVVSCWKHMAGSAGSIRETATGKPLTGVGPLLG